MKKYLVSYKYKDGDEWEFGDRIIPKEVSLFDRKLGENDIDRINRFIREEYDADKVVISNIIPLPI